MKKYEYNILKIKRDCPDREIESYLTAAGHQGWELCGIYKHYYIDGKTFDYKFVLKREL